MDLFDPTALASPEPELVGGPYAKPIAVEDATPGWRVSAAPRGVLDPSAATTFGAPVPSLDVAPVTTPPPVSADVIWTHQDPAGPLNQRMADGVARAVAGNWGPAGAATYSPTAAIADFRALLGASLIAVNDASKIPPVTVGDAQLKLLVPSSTTPTDGAALLLTARPASAYEQATIAAAAESILRGWEALADRVLRLGGPPARTGRWFTDGAGAAVKVSVPGEAGAVPPIGWPGAIVIVAGIAAVAYLGTNAAEVLDRELARVEDTKRLTALIANLADMVEAHAVADRKSGVPTPLSPGEAAALASLDSMIKAYGAATIEREKTPIGGGAGGAAAKVADSLSTGAIVVVALVVAYALFSKKG